MMMNYDDFIEIRRGRLIGLERLEDRIRYAMRSVSIPYLNVDEITTILNGSYMKKPEPGRDPKQIVVDWCAAERDHVINDWELQKCYSEDGNAGPRPETSSYEILIAKVQGWTMLEALKIIRIFEEIDKLSLCALRLTPEGVHRLLADTRVQPA